MVNRNEYGEQEKEDSAERTYAEAHAKLKAWHTERLEWLGRTFQWLMVAHGGGATATAAYIGVTRANGAPSGYLYWSIGCFLVAIIFSLLYAALRMGAAQALTKYLKDQRKKIRTGNTWNYEEAKKTKLHDPPLRWEIYWGQATCGLNLALFATGVSLALAGLIQ